MHGVTYSTGAVDLMYVVHTSIQFCVCESLLSATWSGVAVMPKLQPVGNTTWRGVVVMPELQAAVLRTVR